MPRFGFKELFLFVALFAIGVGMIRLVFRPMEIGDETTTGIVRLALLVTSVAFFGAAIAAPFKRAGLVAAIGPVMLVVGVALVGG
jgi:hypothetical protein